MLWFYLSLLAAMIWASANIIDKVVLSKYIKNPLFAGIVTGFVSLSFAFMLSIGTRITFSLNLVAVFSILSGIVSMMGMFLYFKSMRLEEASRISSLLKLSPLFVLFLATVFLNEVFTSGKYLGIFLIIAGSILISIKSFGIRIKYTKALPLMVLSAFLGSIEYVVGKYLLGFTDYWNYFFWFNIGVFIAVLPVLYFQKKGFIKTITNLKKRMFLLVTSESLTMLAAFLVIIAFSMQPVSLVYTLSSIQPLFVLAYAILLSRYFPKIMKESIDKKSILTKLIAIFMIVAGIYFIS